MGTNSEGVHSKPKHSSGAERQSSSRIPAEPTRIGELRFPAESGPGTSGTLPARSHMPAFRHFADTLEIGPDS